MAAGGLPTVQVLLDDGTGTFPYDLTNMGGVSYVRMVEGYKFSRGRQDELSSAAPGTFALVLDNTDGRFTVGSTIIATPSPIKMDQLIRVKVTANATTVTRFTQAVQSWPTEWPDGGDLFAVAAISGADLQLQAERRTLLSIVQEEIQKDSPSFYYTMGEPAGATAAADSTGNQTPALQEWFNGPPVTFGTATGPGTDSLTAATFANPPGQFLHAIGSFVPVWLTCAFNAVSITGGGALLISVNPDVRVPDDWWSLGFDSSGHLFAETSLVQASYTARNVVDSTTHVASAYLDVAAGTISLYLDGLPVATSAPGVINAPYGGGQIDIGNNFSGTLAHVAGGTGVLTAARAAAHAQAMLTGFVGESDTARLTRLASYANLPVGALDASLTNVAFEDLTGKKLMDAIRDVADAGLGLAYFDGSGSLVLHNRNRVAAKTGPDVTVDASFLDDGTRFEYDMQGVLNYLQVTAVGTSLTQVARNLTSEVTNKHGRYDANNTYLVQTDQEALDRGNWIVTTHGEPAARVGSLVFDVLTMTAAQQATMLAIEPDTWIRVTGLPGQTVGGTTADFIVQGIAETLTADEWTLTLNAANQPVLYPTPCLLNDATHGVLDSTLTRLYV